MPDFLDTVFEAIEHGFGASSPPPTSGTSLVKDAPKVVPIAEESPVPMTKESPKEKRRKKKLDEGAKEASSKKWEKKWESFAVFNNPSATEKKEMKAESPPSDLEQARQEHKRLQEQLAKQERELKEKEREYEQQQLQLQQMAIQKPGWQGGSGNQDMLDQVFSGLEAGACPNSSYETDSLPLLRPRKGNEPQFQGFVIHKLRKEYPIMGDDLSTLPSTWTPRTSSSATTKLQNNISPLPPITNERSSDEGPPVSSVKVPTRQPLQLPGKEDGDVLDQLFASFEAGMGLQSSSDVLHQAHVAMILKAQQEAEEQRLKEEEERQRRMEAEQARIAELEAKMEASRLTSPSRDGFFDTVIEAFEFGFGCAATPTSVY